MESFFWRFICKTSFKEEIQYAIGDNLNLDYAIG